MAPVFALLISDENVMNKLSTIDNITDAIEAFNECKMLVLCPFCRCLSDLDTGIEGDEYVDRPMLWCIECGAYSIFLFPNEVPWQRSSSSSLAVSEYDAIIREHLSCDDRTEYYVMQVQLAYITRFLDHILADYEFTVDRPSTNDLKRFMAAGYNRTPEGKDIAGEIGLVLRPDPYDGDVVAVDAVHWEFAMPVDSYNATVPAVAYPPGFDTSHDGCYAYLEYAVSREDALKGNLSRMKFWGD